MKPAPYMWHNTRIVPLAKGNAPAFHQGLNYGACVYEGIRVYRTPQGPAVFRLNDHITRFCYSAHALRMVLPQNTRGITNAIAHTIRRNKLRSGYIRPMAFYAEPRMGINILGAQTTFNVFAWPWRDTAKPEQPVTLKLSPFMRLHPSSVDLKAKISGYYANGLLAFIDARESGFHEPLFTDLKGFVAEGAVNNIFVVKKGVVYTPPEGNILAGITRDTVITLARDLGITVHEKHFKPSFLKGADEIFLTGTGIELKPVSKVDTIYKAPRKAPVISRVISDYYRAITRGEVKKYKKWLTHIS